MTAVLLISGSTRSGSTNAAALRTVAATAPKEVDARWYGGLTELPAFIPGADPAEFPAVADLRAQLCAADAVLFCTPEYAGTLPGSLKNLLDWVVGTSDLNGKPTAWINIAVTGRGDGAIATLAQVLGYVGADVAENECVRLPVRRDEIHADGLVHSDEFRRGARNMLTELANRARWSASPR